MFHNKKKSDCSCGMNHAKSIKNINECIFSIIIWAIVSIRWSNLWDWFGFKFWHLWNINRRKLRHSGGTSGSKLRSHNPSNEIGFGFGFLLFEFHCFFLAFCRFLDISMVVLSISNFQHFISIHKSSHNPCFAVILEGMSTTPIAPIIINTIANEFVLAVNQRCSPIFDGHFRVFNETLKWK